MKDQQVLCSVAVSALLCSVATPALAQATAGAQPSVGAATAEADDGARLDEVVVTARRRSERAQDTPISLTVLEGTDMAERSITTFNDLQQTTPSLRITPSALSSTSSFISLRGQSVNESRLSVDPSIAIYVDGVALPRAVGVDTLNLLDIERVEILKGPQGTLFGKNTTGGAINITTGQARLAEWQGLARGRLGSYGTIAAGGMINIPVSETFALRLVGDLSSRDGFGRNRVAGNRHGKLDAQTVRATALWEPAPQLSLTLRGDYTQAETTPPANKGATVTSATGLALREVAVETGLPLTPAGFAQARTLIENHQGRSLDGAENVAGYDNIEVWGFSGTIAWELNDALTLKSITAQRHLVQDRAIDLDGTPYRLLDIIGARVTDEQFSQEVQLAADLFDDRLNLILGGYYAKEDGTEFNVQRALGVLSAAAGPTVQDADVVNETIGAFAQGSFKISDTVSITGGIRYTEDQRSVTVRNRNSVNCLAFGRPLAAGPCVRDVPTVKFDAITYTASLEYKPRSGLLIYLKTNRGYRTGGVYQTAGAATPAAADATFAPFQPEYVTDYEVGLKADWLDRRLRTNVAYFHSDYSDIQRLRAVALPGTTAVVNVLQNIAKAKIDGVEVDVTALPIEGLELQASVAYTDARFTDYTVNGVDLTATPFALTPKWSYGLTVAYTAPLSVGSLRLQADYMWEDEAFVTAPNAFRRSLGLLNARVTLQFEELDLDVAIYGRNLTDERRSRYRTDVTDPLGFIFNGPNNEPRAFGVEVTKRF